MIKVVSDFPYPSPAWSVGVAIVRPADGDKTVINVFPRSGILINYTILTTDVPASPTNILIYHDGTMLATVEVADTGTTWTPAEPVIVAAGGTMYAEIGGAGMSGTNVSIIAKVQ